MAITPRGNPRNEGFDLPIPQEARSILSSPTLGFEGSASLLSSGNAASLPTFHLHGFPAPKRLGSPRQADGSRNSPSNPQDFFDASDIFKIAENTPVISGGVDPTSATRAEFESEMVAYYEAQGMTNEEAKKKANLRYHALTEFRNRVNAGSEGDYEALINSDIAADVDLTRFMVSCSWESLISAPYSNAQITLRMPSALAHYLLHGRLANVDLDYFFNQVPKQKKDDGSKVALTDGFRHIEAGGWVSLRHGDGSGTMFLGKAIEITIDTVVDPQTGVMSSTIALTCASFLYPYIVGEHRKTPLKAEGGLAKVDTAAIAQYTGNLSDNTTLEGLVRYAESTESLTSEMLSFYLKELGHFILPPSLVGDISDEGYRKLGANLRILDGTPTGLVNTVYSLASSYIDSIDNVQARPEPSFLVQAFAANNMTMWQIICSIFQPDPSLIELFPVLLPIPDREAATTASGVPQSLVVRSEFVEENTGLRVVRGSSGEIRATETVSQPVVIDPIFQGVSPLAARLGAVPALMYRFKPLPPDFDISTDQLGKGGRFAQPRTNSGTPYSEQFFGARNRRDDLKTKTGGYQYLTIKSSMVRQQTLTWSDLNRINAIHLAAPFEGAEMAERLLFGVSSVPVFNATDINRNGLRMRTGKSPFYRFSKKTEGKDPKLMIAASAYVERLYYLIGEGHSYADGTIVCTLINNKTLQAGMWCKLQYEDDAVQVKREDYRRNLMTGGVLNRDLHFYITGVRHTIAIDPSSGKPEGATHLTITRASYSSRIPAVELRQTPNQVAPNNPPSDPSRLARRRPNIVAKAPQIFPATPQTTPPQQPAPIVAAHRDFTPADPTAPQATASVQTPATVDNTTEREAAVPVQTAPAAGTVAAEPHSTTRAKGYFRSQFMTYMSDFVYDEQSVDVGGASRLTVIQRPRASAELNTITYARTAALDHPVSNLFDWLQNADEPNGVVRVAANQVVEWADNPFPKAAPYIYTDLETNTRRVDRYGRVMYPEDMRNEAAAGGDPSGNARGWLGFWDPQKNLYRIQWTDGTVSIVRPIATVDSTGAETPIPEPALQANGERKEYKVISGGVSGYRWQLMWYISASDNPIGQAALDAAAARVNTAENREYVWFFDTPR